jgi:hypothetical protein
LAKSELVDRPKEDRQRKLAAETQRYSYLTGNKANPVEEANPFGSAMEYGATGFSLGQQQEAAQANQELQKRQMAWFDRASPPPIRQPQYRQLQAPQSSLGNDYDLGPGVGFDWSRARG